jgi:hypothetical protein
MHPGTEAGFTLGDHFVSAKQFLRSTIFADVIYHADRTVPSRNNVLGEKHVFVFYR